jgi:pyrimidine-nucleoside phosphorylase
VGDPFLPDACPGAFLLWPRSVRPYELIKAKRDGRRLRPEDIQAFIQAYTAGDVPDYQMSALCMAIFFRGLDAEELSAWAQAMLHSGEVLDLSDIPGTKVDKHSTGGVGDKVSLSLAPLAAACGVPVPMISGRGLGHTGGTLDKLESIPGFQINLPVSEYRRLVRELDCCLIGQTASVAPADKKLYALRDVTATVDCLPLIASSIMSKKLASGLDALVLDVKVGSGAFMKTQEDARTLARTMIGLGAQMGRKVTALLTDMSQPLGRAVGNALEVVEAVEMLHGRAPEDYTEVTLALTAEMLVLGGKARSPEEARAQLHRVIRDGSAVRKLKQIVQAQGGDPLSIDDYTRLPQARSTLDVGSPGEGFITHIETEAVGLAAVALGAGRQRVDSRIDPAVGFTLLRKVGERVKVGEPLVRIHYNEPGGVEDVRRRLLQAYAFGAEAPAPRPLVLERLE